MISNTRLHLCTGNPLPDISLHCKTMDKYGRQIMYRYSIALVQSQLSQVFIVPTVDGWLAKMH